jgi:hypothetical protein
VPARFRVVDLFHVTNCGPVALGDIVEGTVRTGMFVRVPGYGPLEISAVEFADNVTLRTFKIGLLFKDAPPLETMRTLLPTGTEVEVLYQPSYGNRHAGLRRFWFPLSPGLGIGVTEFSEEEAYRQAERIRREAFPNSSMAPPIRDVDVSTLDDKHVLPNAGPSAVRGVWYPFLNM